MLAFLLPLYDFKTKTIFGFLSSKYKGHAIRIFLKNLKMSSFGRFYVFGNFRKK